MDGDVVGDRGGQCVGGRAAAARRRHRLPGMQRDAASARPRPDPHRARCRGAAGHPHAPQSQVRDCGRTQILLPTELTVRRADTTEAIGNALLANVAADGIR